MTSAAEPLLDTIEHLVAEGELDPETAATLRRRLAICGCGARLPKAAVDRGDDRCAACRRVEELAAGAPPLGDEQADRLRILLGTSKNATSIEGPKQAVREPESPHAARAEATDSCIRCPAPGWPLCPSCSGADADESPRHRGEWERFDRTTGRPVGEAPELLGADAPAIRRWLRDNGHNPPQRGRLPAALVDVWRAAGGPLPSRPPSIREWARENGHGDLRGRIPARVAAAWRAANPDAPRQPFEVALERNRAAPKRETVREWAWRNGHTAPPQGRVPIETIAAWRRAHPDAPELAEERRIREVRARRRRTAAMTPTPPADQAAVDRLRAERNALRERLALPPEPPRAPAPPPPARRPDRRDRACADCGTLLGRNVAADRCASCRDLAAGVGYRPLARLEHDRSDDVPSRLSGVELKPLPGEIVLSGGVAADLTIRDVARDDDGRVICSRCSQSMSRSFGCGCDEGEYDDDGRPLDPRWATGSFLPAPLPAGV